MKNRKRMIAFLAAAALIFSIGAVKIFPVAVQAAEAAQTESQNAEAATTQSGFTAVSYTHLTLPTT